MSMSNEKLHEIREWSTFVLSFLTVVAIPVGLLILSNQRMQIEREVGEKFVSKTDYVQDRIRFDQDRREEAKHIGEIQGKLDSLLLEQVHMNDTVSLLKEEVIRKNS